MRVLVALLVLVMAPACTGTNMIHPPSRVSDPVHAAVLDHGRHPTLVVEVPSSGGMRRYSYGDWRWYALDETGLGPALTALGRPSQAALARQTIPGPFSPESIRRNVPMGIEDMVVLQVERRAAEALAERLDALFLANAHTMVRREDYGLDMVHHPEPYSWNHDSIHMVIRWLEELGASVEGPGNRSEWRLAGR